MGFELYLVVVVATVWPVIVGYVFYQNINANFKELKGATEMFMKAPVLRQYVEKSVPVLMTREQESEFNRKVKDREKEWEKIMGFSTPERDELLKKDLNAEDLKQLDPQFSNLRRNAPMISPEDLV